MLSDILNIAYFGSCFCEHPAAVCIVLKPQFFEALVKICRLRCYGLESFRCRARDSRVCFNVRAVRRRGCNLAVYRRLAKSWIAVTCELAVISFVARRARRMARAGMVMDVRPFREQGRPLHAQDASCHPSAKDLETLLVAEVPVCQNVIGFCWQSPFHF